MMCVYSATATDGPTEEESSGKLSYHILEVRAL